MFLYKRHDFLAKSRKNIKYQKLYKKTFTNAIWRFLLFFIRVFYKKILLKKHWFTAICHKITSACSRLTASKCKLFVNVSATKESNVLTGKCGLCGRRRYCNSSLFSATWYTFDLWIVTEPSIKNQQHDNCEIVNFPCSKHSENLINRKIGTFYIEAISHNFYKLR